MDNKDFDVEKMSAEKTKQERREKMRQVVDKALADASIDEEKVLRMRFGANAAASDDNMDELKKYMGLTRERIREIENKALAKLKDAGRVRHPVADAADE